MYRMSKSKNKICIPFPFNSFPSPWNLLSSELKKKSIFKQSLKAELLVILKILNVKTVLYFLLLAFTLIYYYMFHAEKEGTLPLLDGFLYVYELCL